MAKHGRQRKMDSDRLWHQTEFMRRYAELAEEEPRGGWLTDVPMLPPGPEEARARLEQALEHARNRQELLLPFVTVEPPAPVDPKLGHLVSAQTTGLLCRASKAGAAAAAVLTALERGCPSGNAV